MIRFDHVSVMNLENAIRGARNPLASWEKSDSFYNDDGEFILGDADLSLATRLAKAGSDHRKFIRQIFVSVDITAPLYWWKEFDTYKVGTVANSTSTMHKIHAKPITADDFSTDHLTPESERFFNLMVDYLESVRLEYMETKDKALWYDLITLLPESYEQTRTVTMNYENLVNMYHARKNHKLDEWHTFCDEFVLTLPYAKQLIVIHEEEEQ
ncbi:MAG: hypothetical protein IIW31_09800 [Clostridia bacterium]|nr:hypothetical protein [Clostridia bacterium]MBQ5821515.1 hypothetical protein [Clostridia bacterium]